MFSRGRSECGQCGAKQTDLLAGKKSIQPPYGLCPTFSGAEHAYSRYGAFYVTSGLVLCLSSRWKKLGRSGILFVLQLPVPLSHHEDLPYIHPESVGAIPHVAPVRGFPEYASYHRYGCAEWNSLVWHSWGNRVVMSFAMSVDDPDKAHGVRTSQMSRRTVSLPQVGVVRNL